MDDELAAKLTDREIECLRLVHVGLPLDDIAERVGLSVPGVKYRLKGARQKLCANRSDQAARMLFGPPILDYPSKTDERKSVSPPPLDCDLPPPSRVPVEVAVEDHRVPYQVGPTPPPPLPLPLPLVGRTSNELTWPWKLLLGLLCGFLALTSVGAALRLGDALR